jgi:hypothetical protein
MDVEVDLFGANQCRSCDPRGSGKCGGCFGTGQNIHLNSPDPQCSRCGGNGVCPICRGTGTAQAISTADKGYLTPIGLRLVVSIFLLIVFTAVVMGTPVHWGSGGSVMPRWLGVVFVLAVCGFVLKSFWTGITLADMQEFYSNLRHPAQIESLFGKDKPD